VSYQKNILHLATAATSDGAAFSVANYPNVAVHFVNTGSPNGTVNFEGTINDTDWVAVPVEENDGDVVTSTTATGYFRLPRNHGLSQFRTRVTRTSGTFTLLLARSGRR
jgi:hypothetical protein